MKSIKGKILFYLLIILMLVLSACSEAVVADNSITSGQSASGVTKQDSATQTVNIIPVTADFEDDDFSPTAINVAVPITLNGEGISVPEGNTGVIVNGSIATISAAGEYLLSGTLNDGQIIVETEDTETVLLFLAGVNIHCESSAPIYVANADKVIITLMEGTVNNISDGTSYTNVDESGEPNAALFSHDDLTINGTGALSVTANYNNGIASKDDLKITGGTITVTSVDDGIKGKDSISIYDGTITLKTGGDGFQSTNVDEAEKGFIAIEGGTFNINSADDAINAATSLVIDGGAFTINAGDDGMHAGYALTINGGNVNILGAYEGLESSLITINDGDIRLVTSDDGLNATTGMGGGQTDGSYFYINGGTVFLDASGDGLDSNGTAIINGGVVIVQGPTQNNNGPLDVNGELEINGGTLIVSGSAGMPEIPSTNSDQNTIAIVFDTIQAGGTVIHLENADGEEILTYESPKEYQLLVFSSPDLQMNTTYNLYLGGTTTGVVTNGVYTNANYTPGEQIASLEITTNVTIQGNFESGRGGRSR